ncbi:RNA polymerase sigma factor [Labilithrix luteola]|uniref:RNA polymerase sigma factor n=1 Tax=Labilithrix luteola TaxID=1391654 RepID=UPI001476111A|nr:sigma-70 family RNA polymerase sigma factor [Labilithrix luteola]
MQSRPTFDEVYERYLPFVWRVLRTLELPTWAIDDAVQEVFVVVHRRLSEFEGRSDIRTWLFRVATWVAANERRRVKANAPHELIDEAIPDNADGPFEVVVRSETIRTLERVLDRMDSEKRMVLVLMDIEEMKATELAEIFGINVNTVYSRLRLAREQFRRLFDENAPLTEAGGA